MVVETGGKHIEVFYAAHPSLLGQWITDLYLPLFGTSLLSLIVPWLGVSESRIRSSFLVRKKISTSLSSRDKGEKAILPLQKETKKGFLSFPLLSLFPLLGSTCLPEAPAYLVPILQSYSLKLRT